MGSDLKKENPLLADVRVRRALLMAMDRQTMVDKLFHGTQPVAATWVNPLSPNYDPAVPVAKFDLAGAQGAAEGGWLDARPRTVSAATPPATG